MGETLPDTHLDSNEKAAKMAAAHPKKCWYTVRMLQAVVAAVLAEPHIQETDTVLPSNIQVVDNLVDIGAAGAQDIDSAQDIAARAVDSSFVPKRSN
jgi:hypothetical protein